MRCAKALLKLLGCFVVVVVIPGLNKSQFWGPFCTSRGPSKTGYRSVLALMYTCSDTAPDWLFWNRGCSSNRHIGPPSLIKAYSYSYFAHNLSVLVNWFVIRVYRPISFAPLRVCDWIWIRTSHRGWNDSSLTHWGWFIWVTREKRRGSCFSCNRKFKMYKYERCYSIKQLC